MPPTPILVSWSSGKDSAWALHVLRQQPEAWDVRGIFTTVTTAFDRVSVHGTPRWVLARQARHLGLPLYEIEIPYPCSNDAYEAGIGFTPVFPIWGTDTTRLAHTMIDSRLRAVVNAVDPEMAPAEIAGRWFDRDLLADLPPAVDPLGENGEFHTCVLDGPMFSSPVPARPGRIVRRPVAADPDGNGGGNADGNASGNAGSRECVYADLVRV